MAIEMSALRPTLQNIRVDFPEEGAQERGWRLVLSFADERSACGEWKELGAWQVWWPGLVERNVCEIVFSQKICQSERARQLTQLILQRIDQYRFSERDGSMRLSWVLEGIARSMNVVVP